MRACRILLLCLLSFPGWCAVSEARIASRTVKLPVVDKRVSSDQPIAGWEPTYHSENYFFALHVSAVHRSRRRRSAQRHRRLSRLSQRHRVGMRWKSELPRRIVHGTPHHISHVDEGPSKQARRFLGQEDECTGDHQSSSPEPIEIEPRCAQQLETKLSINEPGSERHYN
jgi:hypothetical protein